MIFSFIALCFFAGSNHPLLLAGGLIMMSLANAKWLWDYSSTFSVLILFLIYVGALLVLFIYVCLVSSGTELNLEVISCLLLSSILVSLSGAGYPQHLDTDASFTVMGYSTFSLYFAVMLVLLLGMLVINRLMSGKGTLALS